MFDASATWDLPLIWSGIWAGIIFLYVVLDGFDLGIGILFVFAPTDTCRNRMMNSIAPFWDGNETWLVLGGSVLLAAFPNAYAILLPAVYIPLMGMLLGLIVRGVAFEFRFKSSAATRVLWDYAFHIGSIVATLCQGIILGTVIQGVAITDQQFGGGIWDWATGFSVITGMALISGYALLGATWLIMKTEAHTQAWARQVTAYVLGMVCVFMAIVSIAMPVMHDRIYDFWFTAPRVYYLALLPASTAMLCALVWRDVYHGDRPVRPFWSSIGIFTTGYIGMICSLFPWMVPFQYTLWEAAASGPTLSILLVGMIPLLPIIIGYTIYNYYVFRGKAPHESMY